MRFLILFCLSLLLLFNSCSREDFTGEWEDEIIIPPSEEIIVDDINGVVRDLQGELLSFVEVELYSEHELISEKETDSQGTFTFYDIIPGKEYVIRLSKEGFLSNFYPLTEDNIRSNEFDIALLTSDDNELSSNPLSPTDPSVIFLTGRLIDELGNEQETRVSYSWTGSSDSYITYTSNGLFSIPVPKAREVFAIYENACNISDELDIDEGPFDDDHNFGNIELDIEVGVFELSGFVVDCFGEAIEYGLLNIYVDDGIGTLIEEVEIDDGFFETELSDCFDDEFIFEVIVGQDSFPATAIIGINFGFADVLLSVCDTGMSLGDGNASLWLDSTMVFESDQFFPSIDTYDPGIIHCFSFSDESLLAFTIDLNEDLGSGFYKITIDVLVLDNVYYQPLDNILLLLEEYTPPSDMEAGYVSGRFEGFVLDEAGIQRSLTVEFESDLIL